MEKIIHWSWDEKTFYIEPTENIPQGFRRSSTVADKRLYIIQNPFGRYIPKAELIYCNITNTIKNGWTLDKQAEKNFEYWKERYFEEQAKKQEEKTNAKYYKVPSIFDKFEEPVDEKPLYKSCLIYDKVTTQFCRHCKYNVCGNCMK